jgi:uncharacterized protein
VGDANIKTIQGVYEAFGRGDVEAILDVLTDDVDWASEPESSIAPWHGIHRGKHKVPAFFTTLAETIVVTRFEPLAFASNDTDVMSVVRFGLRVPVTSKSGEMDIHHWFRFRDGKICLYRGTEDTALTASLLAV